MITKIACLPVAGNQNPYQYLMIKGLNESNIINAFNGFDDRFFGIVKTWKKYKPNYIHFDWIHSYYVRRQLWMTILLLPLFIFQVLFIRYCTKTKIVWTLHNIMPHNTSSYKLNKFVRSFFARNCYWIRVFSSSTALKASKLFNIKQEKFRTVPEGDYVSIYPNKISTGEARNYFKLNKKDKVFLYLGFIRPYKGLGKLIEIFNNLDIQNSKLIIAGLARDKVYLDDLKNKIKRLDNKKIMLKNVFIPENDLQIYYNASDVVILPFSNVENSGSVIMAMGFSKLIVAPRIGVLNERLKNQKEYLYKDLATTIKKVISISKDQLKEIGKKNKESLQKYKWSDFQKQFLNDK
ncbi:glycosyltransferase family 4 protein [Polaribacter sp. Hel_I_88]|uniref:glycosyltransferase family 4 protein n=1 Tax=Polaribacter sp. Hel_I_88 TaxID=1250006 RepID=UPI00047A41D7|nr:glycosyltransferase family 4 protein [Polaribacter sp. Hel_I_88]